jgi:hypothetical protein
MTCGSVVGLLDGPEGWSGVGPLGGAEERAPGGVKLGHLPETAPERQVGPQEGGIRLLAVTESP